MMSQFAINNFANAATMKINENSIEKQSKFNSLDDSDVNDVNMDLEDDKDKHNSSDINKRKNHNCPYCDRSFTRPYRLNDHISFSHTDEVNWIYSMSYSEDILLKI
jgi:hypothetical protein